MRNFCLLLCLGFTLFGCSTDSWTTSEPLAYPFEDIWNTTYYVISRRYDIAYASQEDKEIETNWLNKMSPIYRESIRYKVHAVVEEYQAPEPEEPEIAQQNDKNSPTKYVIKVHVPEQRNQNIDNPASISEAFWFISGNNENKEQLIIDWITIKLRLKFTGSISSPTLEENDNLENPAK